jgi:cytochrome c-type biogenesis protein CcmH
MLAFWALATLMTIVALAFVLVPLLRSRASAGPSANDVTLGVLRGQRQEIEHDIAAGHLPAEARDEALSELVERAHHDLDAGSAAEGAPSAGGKPWPFAATAAVLVPALAFGIYAAVGSPSGLDLKRAHAAQGGASDAQIAEMVESLARKVRERPEDAQGWSLLARSMAALGRFPEAADAYEHLAKIAKDDPDVLADWSDALGMAQGRSLKGRPQELAQAALKLDPKHKKALALAATAALDANDFAAATSYWQRLAAELPPDSEDARQVASILAEVEGRAAAAGRPVAVSRAAAPAAPAAPALAAGSSVTGSVALDPSIAAKVSGGETLFIFARAEGGSRMPLALVRAQAGSLPMKFALDDSQAMAPGVNLSSAQAVRIEARLSRSGNATPQSGDLVGTSAVVKPGARDVKVVVDKVLP